MSLIGSLEKFNLSGILQRIEANAKNGLLIVKQGEHWVELYFRQGQLMCIGPVRSNTSLGDRLLQAGIISQAALQEALLAIEPTHLSETRMALTLIDLGHVHHESLYDWAAKEAAKVIRVLLTWSTGDMYFEEEVQPPAERLLISLSPSSLLPLHSAEPLLQPVSVGAASMVVRQQPEQSEQPGSPISHLSDPPTLFSESQFFSEDLAVPSIASSLLWSESPFADVDRNTDALAPFPTSITPPQRVTTPISPVYVVTSYMLPEMVLLPADLSAQREHNPQVQLTPEQWRLFTRADGQTSLLAACQALAMSREQVCQLAGELVTLGLVILSMPTSAPLDELSPISRDYITANLGNGYVAPGYAASPVQPWAAIMPATGNISQISSPAPVETNSQWGNGGNGATFVLGNGWILASPPSPPSQPLQASGPLNLRNGAYVQVGGSR